MFVEYSHVDFHPRFLGSALRFVSSQMSEDSEYLLYNLFPSDDLNIIDYLWDNQEEFFEGLLSGDKELVRKALDTALDQAAADIQEEIDRAHEAKEALLEDFDRIFGALSKDLKAVDRTLLDFPGIRRESLTLIVRGKLATYRVGLLTNYVAMSCHSGHYEPIRLCIHSTGDIVALGGDGEDYGGLKNPLQTALNLLNDADIKDMQLLEELHKVVMCPWCYKEGRISEKAVEALMKRIEDSRKDEEWE
ncbi:MAG: hypothetical protein ACE5KV_02765 [Thermoplasmata archaeon]